MKARVLGLAILGLAIFALGQGFAGSDDKSADDTIVINITGNGPNAKYIKDGDNQENPVAVKVGQKVKWVNKGNTRHSATSFQQKCGNPVFDTDLIDPNDSKEVLFDSTLFMNAGGAAGGQVDLTYFCKRHPAQMKNGKITLSDKGKN